MGPDLLGCNERVHVIMFGGQELTTNELSNELWALTFTKTTSFSANRLNRVALSRPVWRKLPLMSPPVNAALVARRDARMFLLRSPFEIEHLDRLIF